MAKSPKKYNQSKGLPSIYKNPWNSLRQDFIAVFADFLLRIRMIWRNNLEGNLFVPSFWPNRILFAFWPLLVSFFVFISFFVIKFGFVSFFDETVSSIDQSFLNTGQSDISKTSKTQPKEGNLIEFPNDDAQILDDRIMVLDEIFAEELLSYIKDKDNYFGFLSDQFFVLVKTIDNDIFLDLDPSWYSLSFSQKVKLSNYIYEFLERLGYGEVTISDSESNILAKTSRISRSIFLFDQELL